MFAACHTQSGRFAKGVAARAMVCVVVVCVVHAAAKAGLMAEVLSILNVARLVVGLVVHVCLGILKLFRVGKEA